MNLDKELYSCTVSVFCTMGQPFLQKSTDYTILNRTTNEYTTQCYILKAQHKVFSTLNSLTRKSSYLYSEYLGAIIIYDQSGT